MRKILNQIIFIVAVLLISKGTAFGQIPAEVFLGDKKATVDLMFFRFLKNNNGSNSPFMVFSRNRAAIDYQMTKSAYLPQFGFVEAISYNRSELKGFAPVALVQITNFGLSPKAGVQYARVAENFTAFGWVVCETKVNPKIDVYGLVRYIAKLNSTISLFGQIESLNVFTVDKSQNLNFTQRFRLGLKFRTFQTGIGIDLNQVGLNNFTSTTNTGLFIRTDL